MKENEDEINKTDEKIKIKNPNNNNNNNNNSNSNLENIEGLNKYNIYKKKKGKNESNTSLNNIYISSPNLSERSDNSIGSYCTNKTMKSENSIINIETLFRDSVSEQNSDECGSKVDKDLDEDDDDDDETQVPELVDYSEMIISILYPVCITMVIVVLAIRAISSSTSKNSQTVEISNDNSSGTGDSSSGADKMVFDSVVNSLIFLAVIILSTTIMVVLYKFKLMKALYAWLMGTSILLLGVFGGFLFLILLAYLNLGLDYVTFVIVVWNFSVGGIVCIFWYSPKLLNQGYLISISVLMALFFSRLPDWTTWGILSIVSIYDIFAVLCPGGPLRILIETAQKRNENIPAMIYNASIYIGMIYNEDNLENNNNIELNINKVENENKNNNNEDENKKNNEGENKNNNEDGNNNNNDNSNNSNNNNKVENENGTGNSSENGSITPPPTIPDFIKDEKEINRSSGSNGFPNFKKCTNDNILIGDAETNDEIVSNAESSIDSTISESYVKPKQSIRLGLGDFVFYSVLIGKAASYQITTVFTVFIAIITGLFLTLILLAVFKRALPALPMSIIFGIIVFFLTFKILIQYIYFLGENQIFV
ncbi:hypothetical protein ACTFIR_003713 [Dictyostelium discoideum]